MNKRIRCSSTHAATRAEAADHGRDRGDRRQALRRTRSRGARRGRAAGRASRARRRRSSARARRWMLGNGEHGCRATAAPMRCSSARPTQDPLARRSRWISTRRRSTSLGRRSTKPFCSHRVTSATTPFGFACRRSASSPIVAKARPGKPFTWSSSRYCSGVIPNACTASSENRSKRRIWKRNSDSASKSALVSARRPVLFIATMDRIMSRRDISDRRAREWRRPSPATGAAQRGHGWRGRGPAWTSARGASIAGRPPSRRRRRPSTVGSRPTDQSTESPIRRRGVACMLCALRSSVGILLERQIPRRETCRSSRGSWLD